MNILQVNNYYLLIKAEWQNKKCTYSPLENALEKQAKTIEDKGEKQAKVIEEHTKQLANSNASVGKKDKKSKRL